MATESLFPDGEVGTTVNFTGTFADVDNPQATPGSDWMDPTNDALNNEVTFSMQLPTGDLNTGAGLQSIKLHVRKQLTGGNDPTFDVHIREAGSATNLVTLVTAQTITSETGENFTFTWDASVLAAASGVDVEVHLFGNRSGGGPTARRNLSIGAVEWEADFTAAGSTTFKTLTYSGAGTSSLSKKAEKTLGTAGVGTNSVIKSINKTLSTTAIADSTLLKQIEKVLTNNATGTPVFTKGLLFSVTSNVTALGVSVVSTIGVLGITKLTNAVGSSGVVKSIKKVLSIDSAGNSSAIKAVEKTLNTNAIGTSSTQEALTLTHSSTNAATGSANSNQTFIAGTGLALINLIKRIAIRLGLGL